MEKLCGKDLRKELLEKRRQIDRVDQDLLHLLNERLCIALEIGKIKRQMGERIRNPAREKEIFERIRRINKGPLKETSLKETFGVIIGVCRQSQD